MMLPLLLVAFIIDVLLCYTASVVHSLNFYGHLSFQPTCISNVVKETGEHVGFQGTDSIK